MTNPIPINGLVNVEWEICKVCKEKKILADEHIVPYENDEFYECSHCHQSGVEPVLVENPSDVEKVDKQYLPSMEVKNYKLQIGVPFEIECFCVDKWKKAKLTDVPYVCKRCNDNYKLKFLPIRPLKEGDISVLMVVKTI